MVKLLSRVDCPTGHADEMDEVFDFCVIGFFSFVLLSVGHVIASGLYEAIMSLEKYSIINVH
jgi:hypothetical protein